MKVLHARARFNGPDTHVLSAFLGNDPTFYFNVRYSLMDATLVPLDKDAGEAILVLTDGNSKQEIAGVWVQDGIWRFDLNHTDLSLRKTWQVDSIIKGRRTTHAFGAFTFKAT